jgi:hypothetical protein
MNADAAGDVDAARALVAEIKRMRQAEGQTDDAGAMSINNVARATATGVPIIGGALNQMNAATNAALAPILNPLFPERDQLKGETFAERRAESLRQQQGMDRDFAERNPVTNTAAQIAGGVAGTIPAVLAAPTAFGAGAGTLGMKSLYALASGGAIGAADTAVRSGGGLASTAQGAGIGAGVGFISPFLAAGAGRGVSYLADKIGGFSKPTGPISALPRPAVNYALDVVGDPAKRVALQSELDRLGPQAMLADVSPEWLSVARGAASRPGARDEIVQPLRNRDAMKNVRLHDDLNASLGPAPVPSQVAAGIEAAQNNLSPQYREVFRGARAVDTTPIAEALEADAINLRGPAQQAAQRVRQMLNVAGENDVLDPNPFTLFQTRQAIDGLLSTEQNPKVINVLSNARARVDQTLARAVPGIKDVDAQFAELARQNTALTRGQQVLESGRTASRPQEVAQEVAYGALPQGNQIGPSAVPLRLRQGARAEIDRVVGTNANDPAALQRLVKAEGDWNRDRLRTVFGQKNADAALDAIDRETRFYRTSNRVTSGSDTAMANRFGDFLDEAARPATIPTDTTVAGALLRGGQKVGQKVLGSNAEARAARFAQDLGRLSVAQGDARDRIVSALLDTAQRRQSLDAINSVSSEIARLLLLGSRPNLTEALVVR